MNEAIWQERASHDFVAAMFATFALLAIGLAALGIYGIVTHSVAERKRELGVRIALGAIRARRPARDPSRGQRAGAQRSRRRAPAVPNTRGMAPRLLARRRPVRRSTVRGDGLTLFVVAVLSALIPALRATRIDPVESLRSE